MDDLKNFCCLNPDCSDYGLRGRDNLRVCFRNGPNQQRRVLACRTCQKRFCERKGTPLYRAKLAEEKALSLQRAFEGELRRPSDQPLGGRQQEHGGTLSRPRRRARPRTPRRTRGFFPLKRAKPSSMRSGPLSARKRSTATRTKRTTLSKETTGI